MTFLYEVCRLIPENIKTKSLLKTNYNKMRVSLGGCAYKETPEFNHKISKICVLVNLYETIDT